MPASNKRYFDIGGEVITHISVHPLTGGDCPNCVQLPPNFAKPPGRYTYKKNECIESINVFC